MFDGRQNEQDFKFLEGGQGAGDGKEKEHREGSIKVAKTDKMHYNFD